MSKHQLVRSLRSEIKKLNRIIDRKIMLGLPYSDDSRRHKFLVLQLKRLTPARIGWFSRSMSFVSIFML